MFEKACSIECILDMEDLKMDTKEKEPYLLTLQVVFTLQLALKQAVVTVKMSAVDSIGKYCHPCCEAEAKNCLPIFHLSDDC